MNVESIVDFTHEQILQFKDDNAKLISIVNRLRSSLHTSPYQSYFRVCCIMIIEVDGRLQIIKGSNSEQGYIGGSICSERAALVQLRFFENPILKKVVIVTDASTPIFPGVLCREYMMSLAEEDLPIVVSTPSETPMYSIPLSGLYPFPYCYRKLERCKIEPFAQNLATKLIPVATTLGEEAARLVEIALSATRMDSKDGIHPIRFGAAVLFDNGDIEKAWLLKGLEYGCSLDPVSQLVHEMEKRKLCSECVSMSEGSHTDSANTVFAYSSRPTLLVMVDQFGVAHAPFAQARALLVEFGYGDVQVIVHDSHEFTAVRVRAADLNPDPAGGRMLCYSDFTIFAATHVPSDHNNNE